MNCNSVTRFRSGTGRRSRFGHLGTALLGLFFLQNVCAQSLDFWNPADPRMHWTSEINPAVIPYQETKFSVGLKIRHLGFVPDNPFDLRENRVNISIPFFLPGRIGLGFDMRYSTAGINKEIAASLLLSREVVNNFSVGLKLGIENRSFNKDGFNLVDADDPVLAGNLATNSPNFGLGLFWRAQNLSLGFGMNHINRADIGVGSEALLPREMIAAIGYRIGNIMPTLVLHDDGSRKRVGFFLSFTPEHIGSFRIGHESGMPFKLEATFSLRKDHQLSYTIDLPTADTRAVSLGSHEFVYDRVFSGDIGTPELVLPNPRLEVIRETVTREMPSDIELEDLASNPDLIRLFLSSVGLRRNLMVITAGALSPNEANEDRLQRFRTYAGTIAEQLNNTPDLELILRADSSSMYDASMIKEYLHHISLLDRSRIHVLKLTSSGLPNLKGFEPGRSTVRRKRPELSSQNLQIQLQVAGKNRRARRWRLRIRDASQKVVRKYDGKGVLPATLVWDWKNQESKLVAPGIYTLDFRVQGQSGRIKAAQPKQVEVAYIKRSVKLQFKDGT
ncbi:type IX secretion system membrane protein PorP/SprF [candidate division KSB1 bacterium]|nr:type IX secretion system membrane protein PorP/SprF [candidate division KSB1 bacterium]NIV70237.1 type IX secretion system membrane protein PorP/SprF [Phycisphaerae bacterium]NIR71125.1 type IX secretion system membrane protein PorP/SprF [candidate division KSB1 bacterium]NIS26141.1 type IX secretion system membrane protein PorP/SprF [candidate division KSB1 bacterium]NIT74287.1 type IX secretion system membrane protein PorP/SprF [candidate division KSB1 bacterium]